MIIIIITTTTNTIRITNTTSSIASDLKYGTLFKLCSQWKPILVYQWWSNFPMTKNRTSHWSCNPTNISIQDPSKLLQIYSIIFMIFSINCFILSWRKLNCWIQKAESLLLREFTTYQKAFMTKESCLKSTVPFIILYFKSDEVQMKHSFLIHFFTSPIIPPRCSN